jgi:hypothetical protein
MAIWLAMPLIGHMPYPPLVLVAKDGLAAALSLDTIIWPGVAGNVLVCLCNVFSSCMLPYSEKSSRVLRHLAFGKRDLRKWACGIFCFHGKRSNDDDVCGHSWT